MAGLHGGDGLLEQIFIEYRSGPSKVPVARYSACKIA